MFSFENFIFDDSGPIYLQIVRHVKQMIVAGIAADGAEMPSRRVLSALLGVNPNTVQKAYRVLEEEGLIESRAGAKSFLVLNSSGAERVRAELLTSDALSVVDALRRMGISKKEALTMIEDLWDERGGEQ